MGEIGKPYQTGLNGSSGNGLSRVAGDEGFDADYTEKLRRLSENQYTKSSSNLSKAPPVSRPPHLASPPYHPGSSQHPASSHQHGSHHTSPHHAEHQQTRSGRPVLAVSGNMAAIPPQPSSRQVRVLRHYYNNNNNIIFI